MSDVGLVVARYNEDLTWINDAQQQNPAMNVYIYNKSNTPVEGVYGPYMYQWLPNQGNEAETYLYHMIQIALRKGSDYDGVTLFVQGRPYDHVFQEHLYRLIRNPELVRDFEWLAYHKLDCKVSNQCHHGGLPIAPFYKDLMGKDIEDYFHFGVGGMFAVDRDIIWNVGLERLERARELVLTTYRSNEPWCILERTWDQVLDVPNAGKLAKP